MSLGYTPDNVFLSTDGDGGSVGPLKTQNTAIDGTGTVNTLVTGSTNGTQIFRLRFKAAGGNVKTVARIFYNNGSTNATPSNNVLLEEIQLPETVAKDNEPLATVVVASPLNVLASGKKILVTIGKTVATGWYVSADTGQLPA